MTKHVRTGLGCCFSVVSAIAIFGGFDQYYNDECNLTTMLVWMIIGIVFMLIAYWCFSKNADERREERMIQREVHEYYHIGRRGTFNFDDIDLKKGEIL